MIEQLVSSGHAYPAEGDVYFRVASFPDYGRLSGPPRRRGGDAQPVRGGRGGGAEGGSARLRALEVAQGGRGHVVGLAVGPRPAGLAHRVLGDGRGAPRAGFRDPRRRARPDLPAPRERGRAVALARARVRAALDAQRDAAARRREDVEVARQHRLAARGAGRVGPRDAARLLPRRPLAQAGRLLGRGARAGGRPGRELPQRLSRRVRPRAATGTRSRPRSRTTSTRPRRSPSCTAGATTSCCGAGSRSSGSSRWPKWRRRRPSWRSSRARGVEARAQKDFETSDRLRDEIEAAGWVVRDVDAEPGFQLVPKR